FLCVSANVASPPQRGLPIDPSGGQDGRRSAQSRRADLCQKLLTSFRDAKGITLTVKTLPSLVISAVRLGVGLAEFEHAKIAVRRPAHGKMLARGLRIAQTSLQRIAVKQGTATPRLKRFGGYPLSQFVDIGARGTDFGLQYCRRCPPSADFRPTPRQRLHCQ